MRPAMHCRSSADVISIIERLAPEIDVISFDVFDTLVRRRIVPPDTSKIPAAKALVQILANLGIRVSVHEALERRKEAEQNLRAHSKAAGMDPECRIDDLCGAWLELFLNTPENYYEVNQILQAEIEAEKSVCFAVDGMVEAVRKAQELGKLVVFMSDMYLGLEHITEILNRCGYGDLFNKGYVSSECKLNKNSGRLFRLMLKEEKISPDRWLHFGDDIDKDVRRPKRLGGHAYHFSPRDHSQRSARLAKLERLEKVDSQWAGARWVELCSFYGQTQQTKGLEYNIGYSLLGPLLANFIHCVLKRVGEEDIQLVLFPAREGFVLAEVFRKLSPYVLPNKQIPWIYAFLTRAAVYLASVDQIGVREISMGFWSRRRTPRNFLTRLSLEADDFEGLARECGLISLDSEIKNPFQDFKFLQFVRHPQFLHIIGRKQSECRKVLEGYLDQIGFWQSDRVAYVDVGWRGTVQDALTCAFGERSDWPRLFGLYLGFVGDKPFVETPRSSYEGLLYHQGKHPVGYAAIRFVELLELAARAPHATTTALRKETATGKILPVLKDEHDPHRQRELKDRELLTRLQTGIFDFVDAYARLIPFQQESPELYTSFVLSQLDRFVRLPKSAEGRVFEEFFHSEDFGSNVAAKDRGPAPKLLSFRRLGQKISYLNDSLWPWGVLAANGLAVLAGFLNIWRIFRKGDF